MFQKRFVLSSLRISAALCLSVVTIVAALCLSGCGGSSKPVSVAVTASATTVDATDAVTLSATVANDKNSAGVTWSVSGGGTLSNTTTSGATYTAPAASSSALKVTVTATSVADTAKTGTATLTVPAAPAITTTAAQLAGAVGTAYSAQLAGSGGIAPYTWKLTGGTLPTGWSLTTAGLLSGPAPMAGQAGAIDLTFEMTDSGTPTPLTASQPLAVTIAPAPVIVFTGIVPATGTYNVSYSGSAAATGGAGALTYSLATGALPGGLSLNAGSGAIAGTPTAAGVGTFSFTIKAADAYGDSAISAPYTIVVSYPAVTVTPAAGSLPSAATGQPYSQTLKAAGGSGNYSWTVTGLPSDSLNYSASGATLTVSGTPGTATTVTFTAKVTDTTTNLSAGPYTYSVTVYSGLTLPTPNPSTLGPATAGSSYTGTIAVAGGSGNYTWTVTGLSDGLTYSTSGSTLTVSGTPASAATVSFNVTVKDTSTNVTAGPVTYTIAVSGPLSLPSPDPSSLPATGYTGASYSGTINASGGSGNYAWTVSGLPSDGLSSTSSGNTLTVSGTPTSAATVTFSVTLKDTTTNATITQSGYTITISNPTAVSLPAANPSSLGSATVNQGYNGAINASGGVGPYTWSINGTTVGAAGYSLGNGTLEASNTGGNTLSISGTPSTTGTVTLTNVKVTDSLNTSATKTYTITVSPASTMQITINGVPQGMVNIPYTFSNLNISGGNSPYTISYTNAPAGLSQQSGTGNLAGIPTTSGSTTVTVEVTDSSTPTAQTQSTTFTLPVVPETVAANNSELKGQYACYVEKYWDGGVTGGGGSTLYRGGMVFAFTASGSGNITGGEIDANSPLSGYESASAIGALGGTYAVGSDNRGYMLLSAGGGSTVLALAGGNLDSNSHFSDFAIVEMDDVGTSPSDQHGGGHCYQQNTTGLSGIQLSGGYVLGMTGEDMDGNLDSVAGFLKFSGGTISGVADVVRDGTYSGDQTLTGSYTASTDSYGRMTFTAGPSGGATPMVTYLTNNSTGEAVIMWANPHNAQNDADFLIGELRAQNAAHLAANPFNGPFVMYQSGLDTSLTNYQSMLGQGTATATTITLNASIKNDSGTIKPESPFTFTYTTDPTTGRTTLSTSSGNAVGDVFYVYDTNSAVVFSADTGSGGGTIAQNMIGWAVPQTAPSSGTWATSDFAASYFMSEVSNGDYSNSKSSQSGALTLDSSGAFTTYAVDSGGQNWASWDEGLCGSSCGTGGTATGAVVPDTTLDPNGALGIFDVNATQGSTTTTVSYCIAISVDKATDANTKGHLVCLDATSQSPQLTIVQE